MKLSIIYKIFFIVLFSLICLNYCQAKDFNEKDYSIYIPEGLDTNESYPVILGFSPSGNGKGLINIWKEAADEYNCIIIASNLMRNGAEPVYILEQFSKDLSNELSRNYPIDIKRTIAVGMSGGGMASHLFSFLYPNSVSAVITNVGCINEYARSQTDVYPHNKVCAFLASPTDFNYSIMKIDLNFLTNHDWKCKWIEFQGGHSNAPKDKLKEALDFVLNELNKN